MKCKYGDPLCPCQDGDPCHYEGDDPMTPPNAVHVTPVNDLREHVDSRACWCKPTVETFEGGGMLITHHSMDGRELVERHGLQ